MWGGHKDPSGQKRYLQEMILPVILAYIQDGIKVDKIDVIDPVITKYGQQIGPNGVDDTK